MVDRSAARICGVFFLLSGVLGLVLPPLGMSIGYPIFANFGDEAMLLHFASTWPLPLWFALLQLATPAFALAGVPGFYYVLKRAGSLAVLGVVMACLGMVFTTAQDGIETTLVAYLPRAYAAADAAARPALLAIGNVGTTAMEVFAGRLGIVGYVGLLLVNWAMFKLGGRWRYLAGIGIAAVVFIQIAGILPGISAQLAFAGVGFPVGFILLRVWMIATGVIMIRWKPDAV